MATIDDRLIGSRIRSARLKAGMTQEQLANQLDITEAYCSRIECGKARLNLARLYDFCAVLHVREMDILDGCCAEPDGKPVQETDSHKTQLRALIDRASPATLEMLLPVCEAVVRQSEKAKHNKR